MSASEQVQNVCNGAMEQGKKNLIMTRKEEKIVDMWARIMQKRTLTVLSTENAKEITDPGFYFDPFLKVLYLMSGHMKTGPLPQGFGNDVLELMEEVQQNNHCRHERQQAVTNPTFLSLRLMAKKKEHFNLKKSIKLLSRIYKTIRTEKIDKTPRLWKTHAFQRKYGKDAKGLELLAYQIACLVLAMKFSGNDGDEPARRAAVVGAESVGKSYLVNHLGNPKLKDQGDDVRGILPSTAGMGTQVICIVRDASEHRGGTMVRIGEHAASADTDEAIYKAVEKESNRIKDLKAECVKKKVVYDPGCDVEPMIAQSEFKYRPKEKIKADIMDVPGLKPETRFQTVLAFAIATCLVLCARSHTDLETDLFQEDGQLTALPETLEMAGDITGATETLPVIVMVTRDVTLEEFNMYKSEYDRIARKAFPKSGKFKIMYGNCKELPVLGIQELVSGFYRELRSQKSESSTAATKFNNMVPELHKYLMVLQEGLQELMEQEEEAKRGERNALVYSTLKSKAYQSALEMRQVTTKPSWRKFFEKQKQEFLAERAESWGKSLKKQIDTQPCFQVSQEAWDHQGKSEFELFYQCQLAMLSASMTFGRDHIFHDSWSPLSRFSQYLLQTAEDELCGGNHVTLCKLLVDLFTKSVRLASMDLELADQDPESEPDSEAEGEGVGLLKLRWRAKNITDIFDLQQSTSLGSAWAGYYVLMREDSIYNAFSCHDKDMANNSRGICLFDFPGDHLQRKSIEVLKRLPALSAHSCKIDEKAEFVRSLAHETCKMLFAESNIFEHEPSKNFVLKRLNKLYLEHLFRLLARRNLAAAQCKMVFTPFADYMMRLIGCGSWEEQVINTLTQPGEARQTKADEILGAMRWLSNKPVDVALKDDISEHLGLEDGKKKSKMLSTTAVQSMIYNKVSLVSGSFHWNCGDLAQLLHTDGVDFHYSEPHSTGRARPLKECGRDIQTVSPSIVVWLRGASYATADPTDPEKQFMKSLVQCHSVTHVVIVAHSSAKSKSPQDSDDYEGLWVNEMPDIEVETITMTMEEEPTTKHLTVHADACQLLMERITQILPVEAEEKFRRKIQTYCGEFDILCNRFTDCAQDSQRKNCERYMAKNVERFHLHLDTYMSHLTKEGVKIDETITSEVKKFHLPDKKFLCSAFGQLGEFEESVCRIFLRELIIGQLTKQAKTFAEETYGIFVEPLVHEILTFCEEGVKQQGSVQARSLEDFMAAYENENGKHFEEFMSLKQQNQKKKETKEAADKFQMLTKSSPEEFMDFRTAQCFLTKETYVSMYVGIAIIEATPLMEAMMVPLIHSGTQKYQTYVDNALKFYRDPSVEDDSEEDEEPIGEEGWRQHGAVWEFWKETEWIAYEKHEQIQIEAAVKSGRKGTSLEILTEKYQLNWEGTVKYQINETTKKVRKIRRNPPLEELPEGPKNPEKERCSIC